MAGGPVLPTHNGDVGGFHNFAHFFAPSLADAYHPHALDVFYAIDDRDFRQDRHAGVLCAATWRTRGRASDQVKCCKRFYDEGLLPKGDSENIWPYCVLSFLYPSYSN